MAQTTAREQIPDPWIVETFWANSTNLNRAKLKRVRRSRPTRPGETTPKPRPEVRVSERPDMIWKTTVPFRTCCMQTDRRCSFANHDARSRRRYEASRVRALHEGLRRTYASSLG
jgi:hypothetical protein